MNTKTSPERAAEAAESVRVGLSRLAYSEGRVRVHDPVVAGYDYLVASRQGLFAVRQDGCKLIARGFFFGLTIRDGRIYAFEACDFTNAPTSLGRIVCFPMTNGEIHDAHVVATGLDNGCHQIDFLGDRLHVIDTYCQQIVKFSPDFLECEIIRPFPPAVRGDHFGGYLHFNSLLFVDDRIYLLLHNGGRRSGIPSEIAVLDEAWRELERRTLPGFGCHNIVILDDGSFLCCGSMDGELTNLEEPLVKISTMMTRGLSVDDQSIVVGASMFSVRQDRARNPGQIHFLDRSFRSLAILDLPGAPTDIRRIDGQDYSLSGFHRVRAGQASVSQAEGQDMAVPAS
jgi:hypothetical protein